MLKRHFEIIFFKRAFSQEIIYLILKITKLKILRLFKNILTTKNYFCIINLTKGIYSKLYERKFKMMTKMIFFYKKSQVRELCEWFYF